MKDKKAPEPMDPRMREQAVGTMAVNRQRECWAIKQLVREVHELFPETGVEYSQYDGRNTALAVTFDLTTMEGGDSVVFNNIMSALATDERVFKVETDDYHSATVFIVPGPRTQDVRDEFGLVTAYEILTEPDEEWVSQKDVRAAFGQPENLSAVDGFGGSL